VNQHAAPLLQALLSQAEVLQLEVSKHASGCLIVDAGIKAQGSAEAGRLIAEICMGGLGAVELTPIRVLQVLTKRFLFHLTSRCWRASQVNMRAGL